MRCGVDAAQSALSGRRVRLFLLVGVAALLWPAWVAGEDTPEVVSYIRHIRPLLQQKCQGCHQPAVKQGDLLLTSYENFKKGGQSGPGFVPQQPGASLVVRHVTGEAQPRMPLGGDPLSAEEIELFRRWIGAGAIDDTPAAAREGVVAGGVPVYHAPPVITALAYSPDGELLAVSGYREILLHSSDGAELKARLAGMSDRIHSLVYSPDGSLLAALGGTPARFGEVQFWNTSDYKLKRALRVSHDTLFGASFSPDGSKFAFGLADKSVRVIDVESGKELMKLDHHDDWVFGTTFSLDGRRLVSVGRDRAAKITDLATGAFVENINLLKKALASVARHPTRDVVLIGGAEAVPYLYSMNRKGNMVVAKDSTLIRSFERQSGPLLYVTFSPDGSRVAVGGAGEQVRVYETETAKKIASFTGHEGGIYTLAFQPDGNRLATGGFDGTVRLYEVDSGQMVKAFLPVPIGKPLVAAQ